MIKTYDVHMDPLERTSQIITLTEVINDILVSNSPSRDEKLKALLAILDLAVRDVHFLLSVFWLKKWTLLMSWMRLKRAHLWLTMPVPSW